ncbi:hypothetical protein [Salibacterium aidingense]|uniref:hypothetical protein n=1 Tax=Salibacterium aidingense TaxID=384933 RepID=UPI000478882A|nr:hypothetical protein [Salibacterium aidingense]
MKKNVLLLVLVSIISLFGCNAEGMPVDKDIKRVKIAESSGFGGLNENFIMNIEDSNKLKDFQALMESAEKKDIKVDKPIYDMQIIYEDDTNRGLHLSQKNGELTLMFIGHEEDVYIPSPESSRNVKEILSNSN